MDHAEPLGKQPLFNVPPVTLGLAAVLLVVQLARVASPAWDEALLNALVLIPSDMHNAPPSEFYRLSSYALLHGGWLHLCLNLLGLLAFGSAVERRFGPASLLALLCAGIFAGGAIYLLFDTQQLIALVGISAGLSALLGVMLPLIVPKQSALWRTLAIFLITMVVLGLLDIPGQEDAQVAWQAHLAGFFIGLPFGLWQRRKITKEQTYEQDTQHD